MSESDKYEPCASFAVKGYLECLESKKDLNVFKQFLFGPNCGSLQKNIYENCKKITDVTDFYRKAFEDVKK